MRKLNWKQIGAYTLLAALAGQGTRWLDVLAANQTAAYAVGNAVLHSAVAVAVTLAALFARPPQQP